MRTRWSWVPFALFVSFIGAGCGNASQATVGHGAAEDDGGGEVSGPGDRTGRGSEDAGTNGTDHGSADGGDGSTPGSADGNCLAVDVLFVIDNSSSMCSNQSKLANAFPSFVDAMYDALPRGTDLHVAITTSSFSSGGSHSESNCEAQESDAVIAQHFSDPTSLPIAGNGYQGRLLEHRGRTWFAADTGNASTREPMKDWFTGAATSVGCSGGAFDYTVGAAGYALHPVNANSNQGFLRDEDAVLVIFVLTDEADHSPGGMERYRDMVLDAKSKCGGDSCVITGGLLSSFCGPHFPAQVSDFLHAFGEAPVLGDIRKADYSAVLGDTLARTIEKTCHEIAIN